MRKKRFILSIKKSLQFLRSLAKLLEMKNIEKEIAETHWQKEFHEVIFEAETTTGKKL
jgi:hypothetical protein